MLIGRSRAGAVAVQMARAGTASWQNTAQRASRAAGSGATGAESASARAGSTATPTAAPARRRVQRAARARPRRAPSGVSGDWPCAGAGTPSRRPARTRRAASQRPGLGRERRGPDGRRRPRRRARRSEPPTAAARAAAQAARGRRAERCTRSDGSMTPSATTACRGAGGSPPAPAAALLYLAVRVSPFGLRADDHDRGARARVRRRDPARPVRSGDRPRRATCVALVRYRLASQDADGPRAAGQARARARQRSRQQRRADSMTSRGCCRELRGAARREPDADATGSLGELLPIAAVEPDGLIVTTAGRYVRLIECQRVPNTITADESRLAVLERAFRELCRAIPDRQSLVDLRADRPDPDRRGARGGPRARAGRLRAGHRRRQRRARRDPPAVPGRADADRVRAPRAQSSPPSPHAGGSRSPTSPPLRKPRASSFATRQLRARGKTSWADAPRRGGRRACR